MRFANDKVEVNGSTLAFSTVVGEAYLDRKQLWSDGFYATPGLSWDKDKMAGPFYYYAYGAAVSEVIVDTLTGEWRAAARRHPARRGQVAEPGGRHRPGRGRFIQGMGWLTTEELVWHPQSGKPHAPTRPAPTRSRPPTTARRCSTCGCSRAQNFEDSIHRSKAVGEPPLPAAVLGASSRSAMRSSAAGGHRVDPAARAAATSESILRADRRP